MKYLIVLSLLLIGCGGRPDIKPEPLEPIIIDKFILVSYECGVPPGMDKFDARDVIWKIRPSPEGQVFTLTPHMYENLGRNTSDIIALVKQMKAQKNYYISCIDRSQKVVKEQNETE